MVLDLSVTNTTLFRRPYYLLCMACNKDPFHCLSNSRYGIYRASFIGKGLTCTSSSWTLNNIIQGENRINHIITSISVIIWGQYDRPRFPLAPFMESIFHHGWIKTSKKKLWDLVMKRANWTVVVRVGCGSQPTY